MVIFANLLKFSSYSIIKYYSKLKTNCVLLLSDASSTIENIVFACFYCHSQANFCVESFTEVYNHHKCRHHMDAFRFIALKMAQCFICEKIDNFSNLKEHHKNSHPSEMLVVVDRHNKSKCAFCGKIFSPSDLIFHFSSSYGQIYNPVCFSQTEVERLISLNSTQAVPLTDN